MITDLPDQARHASGAIREDWRTNHDELYPEADTGSSENVDDRGMKWLFRRVV